MSLFRIASGRSVQRIRRHYLLERRGRDEARPAGAGADGSSSPGSAKMAAVESHDDDAALAARSRLRRDRLVGHRASSHADAEAWDLDFWQSQRPEDRLSALVAIRRDIEAVGAGHAGTTDVDAVQNFEDFLELLERHDVRYLIVGGLAFIYHAKPRFTKDIDVWLDPEPGNLARANAALTDFGSPYLLDPSHEDEILQLGDAPSRIDLLREAAPRAFEDAWAGASRAPTDGQPRTGSPSRTCWRSRSGSTTLVTRRTRACSARCSSADASGTEQSSGSPRIGLSNACR